MRIWKEDRIKVKWVDGGAPTDLQQPILAVENGAGWVGSKFWSHQKVEVDLEVPSKGE